MADDIYRETRGGAAIPDEPDAVRSEIEMTRARMSETIDEIEDALLRKKARIQDKLDVLAPVRERPIPSAAIALGAGLVLGLLTGGDDEEENRYVVRSDDGLDEFETRLHEAEERAATWENRARRLMRVAQAQEAELESEYERGGGWREHERDLNGAGEMDGLRDRIAEGVTGFLGTMARDLFAPRPR